MLPTVLLMIDSAARSLRSVDTRTGVSMIFTHP